MPIRSGMPFPYLLYLKTMCAVWPLDSTFSTRITPRRILPFSMWVRACFVPILWMAVFLPDIPLSPGRLDTSLPTPTDCAVNAASRGCLQTVASESWLIKNTRQLYQLDSFGILHRLVSSPEEITTETIAAAYSLGDEAVCTIVSNALKYLGIAISNIAILNNPEKNIPARTAFFPTRWFIPNSAAFSHSNLPL